jgi:hypothetical protein
MMQLLGQEVSPFLSTIYVDHGPRKVLASYFLESAMTLRSRGIELFLSSDVDRLDKLGPDYDAARPGRFPALDASCAGFEAEDWFTLEGWKGDDQIAFILAARHIELQATFRDELESFRLFYGSPASQRQRDDTVDITAPGPAEIRGRIALYGAFWVNPAYRGTGLARIAPTMCRWYSYTKWGVDHVVGFFHKDDAERGLPAVYGEAEPQRWIKFRGRWNDDSYFVCSSREMLDAAIEGDAEITSRSNRLKLVLETNRSPHGARQGSNKRS